MVFSSMLFIWVFLPINIIAYYLVTDKYKNYLLLLSSFIFYSWGNPSYIFLMLLVILINYIFGIKIDESRSKRNSKLLLIVCIVINIMILSYFKYYNFVCDILYNTIGFKIKTIDVILPIGISFYTFQAISYVVDVYNGKTSYKFGGGVKSQRNILNLALYISFFPQLVAGPIIKYKDVETQILNRTVSSEKFAYGLKRFVYGLGKKVILSNVLASNTDKIFNLSSDNLNTPIAWIGIISYTFQIYYDFSGYSDMALGLGKMFGFDYIENFNYPYISKSITEFWRRWHISLSTWFKEYVYIPLGGSRQGNKKTYFNLLIVFFLTGLWHGANWTFIVWGLFHGFFIVFEKLCFLNILKSKQMIYLRHLYVMSVVCIGWIFFRCDSLENALFYLSKLFDFDYSKLESTYLFLDKEFVLVLSISLIFCGIIQKCIPKLCGKLFLNKNITAFDIIILPLILFICIVKLTSGAYNPFIYFQF